MISSNLNSFKWRSYCNSQAVFCDLPPIKGQDSRSKL
nr:MAG TPA_asm: hypothetical protein [Caudoviricetes sp.]